MKYVYAVSEQSELLQYQAFVAQHERRLHEYLKFLDVAYLVKDLPKAIVWTSEETATALLSNIPLPGYTNEFRTVFCPDIDTWREIYLHQLDDTENKEVRRYYETGLTENHILQILGHEFVHHSDLFIDEAYEKAMWFEEGMCEYISRRYFLTEEQFQTEARINALLVQHFEQRHGPRKLEDFCADTYTGTYAGIFCAYWRSFLAVNSIVQRFGGDVMAVFREYRRWFDTSPSLPLSQWFRLL